MTHTDLTHNQPCNKAQPDQRPEGQRLLRNVGQDKGAEYRARTASTQPASPKTDLRAHSLRTNTPRLQKRPKRQTVQLTLWVKPGVRAELERIAESEGLSMSKTGAGFLEKAIQSSLREQHGALLEPIITQAIGRSMRAYSNRIAALLIRVAFASEQTRALVTNVLRHQPGVTPELLNTILDGSMNTAKRTITNRTPQLEELVKEMEAMLAKAQEREKDV